MALRERDAKIIQRETLIARRDAELIYKTAKIDHLTQVIAKLQHLSFGARSERFDPAQQALFDAALQADLVAAQTELLSLSAAQASSDASPDRAQPKRRPLPAELLRVEERIEPESCVCGSCGGDLHCIGEEVSEKLDIKPIEFSVRRTVRPKMACRACDTILTTPTLPAIIERGIAAPGLLAHVLISKYADHIPLNRLIGMLLRSGVELPISTLSEWVDACGVALQLLVDALRAELNRSGVLHADETPVQMLAPGNGKTKTAFLFAYRRGEMGEKPIIVFDFATNRSGANARRFLEHYGGALVVDDYAGYKRLFQTTPMREVACWAHARRNFFELHKANQSTIAAEALTRIGGLYDVERESKDLDTQARYAHRQQHAAPKAEALFDWLTRLRPTVNTGAASAKAIDNLLRRKAAFTAYLDDGSFPIDNNPVENAIRPIAIGRKNWLFAGSEQAGHRAANIMTLIQTAKANGHDPHAYLRDVLTRLPTQKNNRIGELLPHTWKPAS
ncbi:MAG: IS66 family transposase [Pseudomonadota bacterium]|nr:IS66 family transposase [Pseudomonadota bacterium]